VGSALGLADVDYDPDHVAFGEGKQRVEGDMDMTPMVDVTFLLLIFFMVTAAFSLQKSLPVPTPTETTDPSLKAQPQDQEEDRDFVIIHVDAHNTYRVITVDWEREAPSEQEMLIQLREARRGDSKGTIPSRLLVRANGDAEHQKVVAALDAGSEVGMEEIQLQKVEEDE
jgi:biopolymer transport protein ExbD